MKKHHLEYFKAIGIKEPIRARIEEIHQFYSEMCPEEIEDVFVSDYIKGDGTREYSDMRFFSRNFVMFAQNFVREDVFSFAPKDFSEITGVRITKDNYDYKEANENSRMNVDIFYTLYDEIASYQASKGNCDYLKAIIERHILPYVYARA